MTATTDLERALATWLERDGPADVPDRVVEAALAEARTVRQRRAWLTAAWWATRVSREDTAMRSTQAIDRDRAHPILGGPLRLVWIAALIGLLVAATALVAFVGSELLRRSDDLSVVVPVVASPSPTPTEGLLPGMVAEEVEPGVFRVTIDGVRDLTEVEAVDIVAGYDGGIWLLREDGFLRLGSDAFHEWPTGTGPLSHVLQVAPDGTMWVIPGRTVFQRERRGEGLRSIDGEAWSRQPCPGDYCKGVTLAPDGTLWASWFDDWGCETHEAEDCEWSVGYLGPTGWQRLDGSTPGGIVFDRLAATGAGDLYGVLCAWECAIYRYEDGAWRFVALANGRIDVGPDGTVWQDGAGLHRLADGEWAGWTSADIPDIKYSLGFDLEFEVAPDGSLWLGMWRRDRGTFPEVARDVCDGLARFDGETLDRFPPDRCVLIDVATDGSVWVLAAEEGFSWRDEPFIGAVHTWDLYVITPEALAASD